MPTYDKHYQTPNYFGEPYPELLSFFSKYKPKGHVLDLGCGQGRDAIAMARMGYKVTGVDISKVGVSKMISVSDIEGLGIIGIVTDMYGYKVDDGVDIVLLDSMLHFYKPDREKETRFLKRIMNELRLGGVLCVIVWKSKKIETEVSKIFDESTVKWNALFDGYIKYPQKDMEMRMIIYRKASGK